MLDFKTLKQNRARSLEKLNEKVANMTQKREVDARFWSPTVDKAGNGYAVLRFIGPPPQEDDEFIRYWDHGFEGPGGWYIEKSLTSIGKDDPVSEYNTQLWKSGNEADKDIARNQKRRLRYVANVYVLKDPGNPDNEGKTFLYQFGKKIFDKLNDVMHPQFEDEQPVNPFDFWAGADFKLKIRNVEGYRNYDKSEFDKPAPFIPVGMSAAEMKDEEARDKAYEKVWKSQHSLKEFLDPSTFKTYEELQKLLNKVLTPRGNREVKSEAPAQEFRSDKEVAPSSSKEARAVDIEEETPPFDTEPVEDGDKELEFFKNIAKKKR